MQTIPSPYRGGIGNHNGTLHNSWRPYGQSKLYNSRHFGDPSRNRFHTPFRGSGELDQDRTAVYTRGENHYQGGATYSRGSTWFCDSVGQQFTSFDLVFFNNNLGPTKFNPTIRPYLRHHRRYHYRGTKKPYKHASQDARF